MNGNVQAAVEEASTNKNPVRFYTPIEIIYEAENFTVIEHTKSK